MRFKITLVAILLWTAGVAVSLWMQQNLLQRTAVELARNDAAANLRKDMAIRKWASTMGGVFVDDSKVKDSPALAEQERVVGQRSTGQQIRLVSLTPIHILLGIQETHQKEYGIKERLTSLQLRNLENAPDDWEQKALKDLKEGAKIVSDVTTEKGGHGILRLMLPMQMDKECLECHRDTLVPVGGLRGGAAITIDLEKYRKAQEPAWRAVQYGHLAIWLFGMASILTIFFIASKRASEHERAEEARREAELAFASMNEGAVITDVRGKIVWVNDAFCAISGFSRDEVIGNTPALLKSGRHDDTFYRDMWQQLTASGQWRGEIWNKRKSGEIYPEELSIHSLKEGTGRIRRFVAIFSDISERKCSEQALQQAGCLAQAITDAQSLFIANASANKVFQPILDTALALTQSEVGLVAKLHHDRDGLPYLKVHAIANIPMTEEMQGLYEKSLAQGFEFHNLNTLLGTPLKNGETVISNDPVRDPRSGGLPPGHFPLRTFLGVPLKKDDAVIGMIAVANSAEGYDETTVGRLTPLLSTVATLIDADNIKAAHAEALKTLEEAQHIAHLGSWELDLRTHALSWSDEVFNIFGIDKRQFAASYGAFLDHIHPDDREKVNHAFTESVDLGTPYEIEHRIVREDGSIRWVLERCGHETNEHGKVVRALGTILDITERKRIEDALRAAEQSLTEINRNLENRVRDEVAKNREKDHLLIQQSRLAAMGEMVHNIAHQWRQPLNTVNLILANIQDAYHYGELDDVTMAQSVADGNRLIQKMSTTIDDFRNFFRPDREKKTFDLAEALREALSLLDASLRNHHIEVTLDEADKLEVLGYENEYAQVLLNLLNNAKEAILAHKVEHGLIAIRIERDGDAAKVTIRDNGGGIPPEVMAQIFEPYFSTKEMGTGIGLYMSKMIIEKSMGGRIAVGNSDGGAEFVVTCPLLRTLGLDEVTKGV
ncbi:MAG: PAS domain S-box protein [Sulfuricella sp.]|nr:PAS domain S-box protein [Sulfuricella sp.]